MAEKVVIGNAELWHGDCREVLPLLPDACADMVFTSPPYNLGNTTGGGFPGKKLGHYDAAAGMKARGGLGKWGGGKSVDMDALTEQVNREGRQIIAEALRAKNAKLLGGDKAVFIVLEESK